MLGLSLLPSGTADQSLNSGRQNRKPQEYRCVGNGGVQHICRGNIVGLLRSLAPAFAGAPAQSFSTALTMTFFRFHTGKKVVSFFVDGFADCKRMGYGAYLNHLNKIAMAEVWIVDEALNVYTPGCSDIGFLRRELPENADAVVSQVFAGKTTYGAEFSESLGVSSLTVGAPIYFGSEVVGAVLLHSPVSGIDSAVRQGLTTLAIGCIVGLLFAGIAAAILSDRLTRPLRTMGETALLLAQGHYDIQTGITAQDEIGQLARTMDVLAEQL